jgi:hypothetical protein
MEEWEWKNENRCKKIYLMEFDDLTAIGNGCRPSINENGRMRMEEWEWKNENRCKKIYLMEFDDLTAIGNGCRPFRAIR